MFRRFLAAGAGALVLAGLSSTAVLAQDFPAKPITLINPFGPGGQSDLLARPLATVAQKYLGQQLLVKMMPGGQGIIGTEAAAKAAPDGYTLLSAGAGWNSALPAIEGRSKGPDDFEPIARINKESTLMVVRVDSPHKTLKGLIDYAKANPGKLTVGIGGPYTTSETFWRWLTKTQGVNVRLVKFGGGAQMMLAGLGGHVDAFGGSPVSVGEQVRAGKVRPLVFYGDARHRDYSSVPTAKEEGFDIVLEVWNGIAAPKGTPKPIIAKLDDAFKKMYEDATVREALTKSGARIEYLGADAFGKFWRDDFKFFQSLKDAYAIQGILTNAPETKAAPKQ